MDVNAKPRFFATRAAFRKWLAANYERKNELWLLFYKKHTGKKCISYPEAVEEALCYGWIDGILKRVDDNAHVQRYTPRKTKSIWSKVNKERALRLIETGQMTEAGLEKIEAAKKNGQWDIAYSVSDIPAPIPDFDNALRKNKQAAKNFYAMTESIRNAYLRWINYAKRGETKMKRIAVAIERLEQNRKPGWFE